VIPDIHRAAKDASVQQFAALSNRTQRVSLAAFIVVALRICNV